MQCPNCQHENPQEALFCMKCGTKLGEDAMPTPRVVDSPVPSLSAAREAPEAERRQLTVMFCDLVGSTALSEQLDPEELREVLRDYQAVCATVIRCYDGHIARYFGDGLLVYFGYPQAHEDDAQRAVRAGLGIVEGMKSLNTHLQGEKDFRLEVRVGIHTGLVVAGDIDERGQLELMAIVGETPNIAARLQGLAEPDTLVISAATYRLVEGFFDCQDLGSHTLRGISQPIAVYQVLRESAARSRLDVAATTGLTPLVGRGQEVRLLLERWERVVEGIGQVVLLSGEAGIGKSRLVGVLKEHVLHSRNEPFADANQSGASAPWANGSPLLECRCSPYHRNSALYPIIDTLERVVLGFEREDSAREKLRKLERFFAPYGFSLGEMVPLFASLLSIPPPNDRYPPLTLTPQRQKQGTFQAFLRVLLERAKQHPMLFIVEDLQWADPSTLELLNLIVDGEPRDSILTLLTFRSDFSPPWMDRPHITPITLNRLTRKAVAIMVDGVTAGKTLPSEVLYQIVTRTDGVPLFVEELTKMVLESGLIREREGGYDLQGPLPSLAIPTTLQDSLMARLDRLGTAKEVAQLGAVLGREFSYEVFQAVSSLDESRLSRELDRLVEAELLDRQGADGADGGTYTFKHTLIQEAAYQSLLKSTRGQYHQQIAQVLAEQFPGIAETQPGLLAHHYTEAGLSDYAIVYWQRAGQRAVERSANVEAIRHTTRGLELLKTLPDTSKRAQHELILQTTLGPALIATRGYAAPEVEDAYTRARELCRHLGETPQLFPVLFGLWLFYLVRAELQTARELGEQLLRLAHSVKDRAFLLEAHRALGATLYYIGELGTAQEHLDEGIALYDSQQHRSHAFLHYLADPGMTCLSYAAWALWFLGYPDEALKRIYKALSLAEELSHPFSVAVALHFAGLVHQCRWEAGAVQKKAEGEIAISTEGGFPLWMAGGTFLRGWALAEGGQREEGIAQMRQGLAAWCATGAEMLRPYFLALLADAYRKAAQKEKGLTIVTEALEAMDKSGERLMEAELYRLKGELLLMQVAEEGLKPISTETAEICFRQALEVARRQNAKSLELRAAMSLSRLWQRQDLGPSCSGGKIAEARTLLQEIYGWFTEGFDTVDLKEAKELLEEFSENEQGKR